MQDLVHGQCARLAETFAAVGALERLVLRVDVSVAREEEEEERKRRKMLSKWFEMIILVVGTHTLLKVLKLS